MAVQILETEDILSKANITKTKYGYSIQFSNANIKMISKKLGKNWQTVSLGALWKHNGVSADWAKENFKKKIFDKIADVFTKDLRFNGILQQKIDNSLPASRDQLMIRLRPDKSEIMIYIPEKQNHETSTLLNQANEMIKDYNDFISSDDKEELEMAIDNLEILQHKLQDVHNPELIESIQYKLLEIKDLKTRLIQRKFQ